MGKEILTWILRLKKINFTTIRDVPLRDVDIEKVLVFNKISFGEKKTIGTLLVTCIIMINLSR